MANKHLPTLRSLAQVWILFVILPSALYLKADTSFLLGLLGVAATSLHLDARASSRAVVVQPSPPQV